MSLAALSEPAAAFLGVARSLTGRLWRMRTRDERLVAALAQRLDLPEPLARVLAGRGIGLEGAEAFLAPSLRAQLPDPSVLKDMDQAADRLARAVRAGETIAIFGDYDVDGATSSALLYRFLDATGAPPVVYIPDRLAEGYGPNAPALRKLAANGARLIITVDCGVTSFSALEAARECGLETIVVDHHVAEPALPTALAVVNPNRLDEQTGLGTLAAVGVSFLLAVATNRTLRMAGWYKGRAEPDLLRLLDLVALGTVCDVVPLTGLNRALVAQGLKVMAGRGNAGLCALADIAGLDERPDTYHAGFVLGPRINAGGRVGEAGLGADLLRCDDPVRAAALAHRLDGHNRERQAIEAEVLEAASAEAEAQVTARLAHDGVLPPLLLCVSEGWHPGVIGIVAGRVKDRWRRPCFIIGLGRDADSGRMLGKGSGRSIQGVNLGALVIAARQEGLLEAGGGHAMAAGLTVDQARLSELRAFLEERVATRLTEIATAPTLELDGAVSANGATLELVEALERAGPFGAGNPRPRFALQGVRVLDARVVGRDHVACRLGGGSGPSLKAIAFRALPGPSGDGALGVALLQAGGRRLHVAGQIKADRWKGRAGAQLILDDAAFADGTESTS